MAAQCSILSTARARLLLLAAALLAVCASNAYHDVTWDRCKALDNKYARIRATPLYANATGLDLSYCHLTEIKRGDLDGFLNVEVIWSNINEIAWIDPAAFSSVPKLDHLYLSSNKLRELPVFDEHSFPHLTILHLDDNLIKGIYNPRTFSACVKLQELKLAYNKIEYLHPNVFNLLSELSELDLSGNKLSFLPKTMFTSNTKLRWLMLPNNNFAYLPANFVSELGARFWTVYNNPWQCGCLLELLADLGRAGLSNSKIEFTKYPILHDVTHYDGTRPECVFSGAYPCTRPTGLLKPSAVERSFPCTV